MFGLFGAQGLACGEDDPCSCDVDGDVARVALECICPKGARDSLDEALRGPCVGPRWFLQRGCGKVRIIQDGGYTGGSSVYDEATGALIGASSFSDEGGQCNTASLVAGEGFDCEATTECELCATEGETGDVPACE